MNLLLFLYYSAHMDNCGKFCDFYFILCGSIIFVLSIVSYLSQLRSQRDVPKKEKTQKVRAKEQINKKVRIFTPKPQLRKKHNDNGV